MSNHAAINLRADGLVRRRISTASTSSYTCDLLSEALHVPQTIDVSNDVETPIDNVRRLVQRDPIDHPPLFCEMMYLTTNPEEDEFDHEAELCWRQIGRWIKFKQVVEGDGTRFSRPHLTLLTVHSMLQVKSFLRKGPVLLDVEANTFVQVCDDMIKSWMEFGLLDEDHSNMVREVMYAPKMHLLEGQIRTVNESTVPIDRDREDNLKRRKNTRALNEESDPHLDQYATKYEDADQRLLRRLKRNTEAAAIMVANVGALQQPLTCFMRLRNPLLLYPEIPDQPMPVRFLFVLLNTVDNYPDETLGIGRAMGALFSDQIFHKVAYTCKEKFTIADSVEEYFTQATLIPPGKCRPDTRWEPKVDENAVIRNIGTMFSNSDENIDEEFTEISTFMAPKKKLVLINRSGRIFGGLADDVRRKAKHYISDFSDFFSGRMSQSLATTAAIFFANLTNVITFGAVFERATHQQMAAIENVVAGSLCGMIFALFAGQPLTILSATGPTLIFEKVVYDLCTGMNWDFLSFRFWMACWMVFFLLILVATDTSALIGFITRFTEDGFATLISGAVIVLACQKIYEISYEAPITWRPQAVLDSTCHCLLETPNDPTNDTQGFVIKNLSIGVTRCRSLGGVPHGLACFFKPDIFIFSILLALSTFWLTSRLAKFRNAPYLAWGVRHAISDFGVLIAVMVFTLLSKMTGLDVPALKFPMKLTPTMDRPWVVDVLNIEGYSVALFALLPAFFYTILVVMDQQITAGIVNRKDNKLKKGDGYHLDLLVVAVLILACSVLGLPFYVASTVLSMTHVDSLKSHSEIAAPGEKARFLGVKEQRLTAFISHLLMGLSLFFAPVVKLIPSPVLTGVFLYIGTTSLLSQQFTQRLRLLFMPIKNQPDFVWLRTVRMHRVHLFTFIQTLSVISLFFIRFMSHIAFVFPIMLVVMVLVRMFVLERIFTETELQSLDDELPDFGRVMRPRPRTITRAMRNSISRRPTLAKTDKNGENRTKKNITWA